ncbi:hypothetical protein F2Q69_00055762 [Brassica cretica]|uniref:Uncharacterized protein n=1 Tax=Brassica cretica TaxID=69181 RepID=A0A8S9N099_BRACR|nr:hypothetical protein F2Q69_00055762 [Brassica cretica]
MPNRRILGDDEGRLRDTEAKDCQRRRMETSGCRTEGLSEMTKRDFWMPNRRIVKDDEGRLLDAEPKNRWRRRREASGFRTEGS